MMEMGLWTELVGVRKDLRLRHKWWHYAAIGAAIFSSFIVYLMAMGLVARGLPVRMTADNTFSLTLVHYTLGRRGPTSLADLDGLSGVVGMLTAGGELVPFKRAEGAEDIRCENPARLRAGASFTLNGMNYRAIPDYPNQPAEALRHCAATSAYESLTGEGVVVYSADGAIRRKWTAKVLFGGAVFVVLWLIGYWNVYYRGLMPLYARHRQLRRERQRREPQTS